MRLSHLKTFVQTQYKFVSSKENKKLNLSMVIYKFKIQRCLTKKLNEEVTIQQVIRTCNYQLKKESESSHLPCHLVPAVIIVQYLQVSQINILKEKNRPK